MATTSTHSITHPCQAQGRVASCWFSHTFDALHATPSVAHSASLYPTLGAHTWFHNSVSDTRTTNQDHTCCCTVSFTHGYTFDPHDVTPSTSHTWCHSVSHPGSHSMTHPLSTQCPMIEVTYLISHVTCSVSHTQKTPTAPQSGSQCHLNITPDPTSSPLPTPQGNRRAVAPCQGCFLLCSKSSATAGSSKDFLLSGPIRPGPACDTQPKAQELTRRNPGPLCLSSGWTHGISPI